MSTNVVPAVCEAPFDIRIVPPLVPEDAVTIVRNTAADVVSRYAGASFELMPLGSARPPVRASDDAITVHGLRASFARITGRELKEGGADGHEAYTDSAMIAALTGSRSATVFGPGSTDAAHTADEYVPLADIEIGAEVLWDLGRGATQPRWCGRGREEGVIRYVVMFRLTEIFDSSDQLRRWGSLVADLPTHIPTMLSHSVGCDVHRTPRSCSAVVVTDFADVDAYTAHAAHGPLIELCDPYVLEIATVDFKVTGGTPPGHIVNRRGR